MTPVRFFMTHAGFSYAPGAETPAQGRYRCARRLAAAESRASRAGYSFDWTPSDEWSSSFNSDAPAWQLWDCIMRDPAGEMITALCAVDFGADGGPQGQPYRRVVEAEIACEVLGV